MGEMTLPSDWLQTQKVSVVWSAFQRVSPDSPLYPWNDAYIYLNKWAQIQLFPYLKVTQ